MNLDDFLMPNAVASPVDLTPVVRETTSTFDNRLRAEPSSHARQVRAVQTPQLLPPSSVPQSLVMANRAGEFDYVQRRVRKTSMDERRVSHEAFAARHVIWY